MCTEGVHIPARRSAARRPQVVDAVGHRRLRRLQLDVGEPRLAQQRQNRLLEALLVDLTGRGGASWGGSGRAPAANRRTGRRALLPRSAAVGAEQRTLAHRHTPAQARVHAQAQALAPPKHAWPQGQMCELSLARTSIATCRIMGQSSTAMPSSTITSAHSVSTLSRLMDLRGGGSKGRAQMRALG